MPALHGTGGITRGTRAPEGLSPSRTGGTGIYREVPLWPGITWGGDSRCLCSWGYLHGVRQVKVQSGACTVHLTGREAAPPVPPAQEDASSITAALLGDLIALLAEAAGDAGWLDSCGSHAGYNQHARDKTPVCPECEQAERNYSREAKRARKQATAEQAWQEAA